MCCSLRHNGNPSIDFSKKTPDGALFVEGRVWPTIVLEAGYSESYEDLLEDATLLLEGSEGRIGFVILVKLEPLRDGDNQIRSGFVELHYYNSDSRTRAQYRRRLVSFFCCHTLEFQSLQGLRCFKRLYPPTGRREQQLFSLTWRNVLRGEIDNIEPASEAPPSLWLDDLRRHIDRSVPRYLALRSDESLDDERNSLW